MGLLPILAVPFVTLPFLLAQRRLGPEGAGLIGALPSTLPLILIGTALVAGDHAAGTLALSTAAHVPIQVAFAVVFARAMYRLGPAFGLALGSTAFVLLSAALAQVTLAVGRLVAVPELLLGPRMMSRTEFAP